MGRIRRTVGRTLRSVGLRQDQTRRKPGATATPSVADQQVAAALSAMQTSLERSNELLARVVGAQEQLLAGVESQRDLVTLVADQKRLLTQASRENADAKKWRQAVRFELTRDTMNSVEAFAAGHVADLMDTVAELAESQQSFARFGDGEFKLMLRPTYMLKFQPNSSPLRKALRNVLAEPVGGLTLGFPSVFRNDHGMTVWTDIWSQLESLVAGVEHFGNSHVSRPLFFEHTGEDGVAAWRRVWDGLKVCVITGKDSRFEAVPALFDGVSSFERLDSVSSNAFGDLPRVLGEVDSRSADLFLISLGPAGTVLAHELAKRGRRAIDIGHISDSYLNVFEGGAWPESKPVTGS